jgi:hypothetical protein
MACCHRFVLWLCLIKKGTRILNQRKSAKQADLTMNRKGRIDGGGSDAPSTSISTCSSTFVDADASLCKEQHRHQHWHPAGHSDRGQDQKEEQQPNRRRRRRIPVTTLLAWTVACSWIAFFAGIVTRPFLSDLRVRQGPFLGVAHTTNAIPESCPPLFGTVGIANRFGAILTIPNTSSSQTLTTHCSRGRETKLPSAGDNSNHCCCVREDHTVLPFAEGRTLLAATTTSFSHSQKAFYELLVHPVLVASTDPPPTTVGIIIMQEEASSSGRDFNGCGDQGQRIQSQHHVATMVQGLIREISLHRSVREVTLLVSDEEDCESILLQTTTAMEHYPSPSVSRHRNDALAVDCRSTFDHPSGEDILMDVAIWPYCNLNDYSNDRTNDDDDPMQSSSTTSPTREWVHRHLSPTGSLVFCAGRTLPFDHPRWIESQRSRLATIRQIQDAGFVRIIDYDVPTRSMTTMTTPASASPSQEDDHTQHPHNFAVAVKSAVGIAGWRMSEAHYQLRMRKRFMPMRATDDHGETGRNAFMDGLVAFDGATMLQLLFPAKHSAEAACSLWDRAIGDDDEDGPYCNPRGHGYDPDVGNVPLDELYVSKSMAGENAGRGVFTKVDIPFETYLALETTVHAVIFEWPTVKLHEDMLEYFSAIPGENRGIPDIHGNIVSVFARAYGYKSRTWGMEQEFVMSNIITFGT